MVRLTPKVWTQKRRLLKLPKIFIQMTLKNLPSFGVQSPGSGIWPQPDPHPCLLSDDSEYRGAAGSTDGKVKWLRMHRISGFYYTGYPTFIIQGIQPLLYRVSGLYYTWYPAGFNTQCPAWQNSIRTWNRIYYVAVRMDVR